LDKAETMCSAIVTRAASREAALVEELSRAQAQLESLEHNQRSRFNSLCETYQDNFNAVGLVGIRLDELSAQMVERDLRRRRHIWSRVGWLLADGAAWLVWLLISIFTFAVNSLLRGFFRYKRSLTTPRSSLRSLHTSMDGTLEASASATIASAKTSQASEKKIAWPYR
jgi:hypothetical protein